MTTTTESKTAQKKKSKTVRKVKKKKKEKERWSAERRLATRNSLLKDGRLVMSPPYLVVFNAVDVRVSGIFRRKKSNRYVYNHLFVDVAAR